MELLQQDKERVSDFRMKSYLFWDIIGSRVVFSYRHFGATDRSNLQWSSSPRRISETSWPLKMAPMDCPKTSVTTNQRCVTSQKSEYLKILYVLRHRTPTDGKKRRYCGGVYVDRRLVECEERFLWNVLIIRQATWRHSNLHDRWFYLHRNPFKTTQIYVIRMCMEDL